MPIPTAPFGRTGHVSSRVIFGGAALAEVSQGVADRALDLLLRHDVNHIDVAASYGDAELRRSRGVRGRAGHMAVSASGRGGLLLRVDPADTESLLSPPHVGRFEMRGREMDGWLRVDPAAVESDEDLRRWVRHGVSYARALGAG